MAIGSTPTEIGSPAVSLASEMGVIVPSPSLTT